MSGNYKRSWDTYKDEAQNGSNHTDFFLNDCLLPARRIRHEVNNHLQVAYGLAQLEGHARIMNCLDDVKQISETLGRLSKLLNPRILSFFLKNYSASFDYCCCFNLKIETDLYFLKAETSNITAQTLDCIHEELVEPHVEDSNAVIYWHLGEDDSCYFFSLIVQAISTIEALDVSKSCQKIMDLVEPGTHLIFEYETSQDSLKAWLKIHKSDQ